MSSTLCGQCPEEEAGARKEARHGTDLVGALVLAHLLLEEGLRAGVEVARGLGHRPEGHAVALAWRGVACGGGKKRKGKNRRRGGGKSKQQV